MYAPNEMVPIWLSGKMRTDIPITSDFLAVQTGCTTGRNVAGILEVAYLSVYIRH